MLVSKVWLLQRLHWPIAALVSFFIKAAFAKL